MTKGRTHTNESQKDPMAQSTSEQACPVHRDCPPCDTGGKPPTPGGQTRPGFAAIFVFQEMIVTCILCHLLPLPAGMNLGTLFLVVCTIPYHFEALGWIHDPSIFNFLYLIIHNMPTNGSFLIRCEIRYGAASAKIKPCSEISLVLRTILYESFVAKPLSQPPLLPNSQKSAMKPHSLHFYTLQTKLVLKKKKEKKGQLHGSSLYNSLLQDGPSLSPVTAWPGCLVLSLKAWN